MYTSSVDCSQKVYIKIIWQLLKNARINLIIRLMYTFHTIVYATYMCWIKIIHANTIHNKHIDKYRNRNNIL